MASESWRSCAKWLVQCGVLPYDHRIMSPDAEVFDLGQTLRDGVILCHLLNHIKPGSIDTLELSNIRSQTSQFLCMKNIRTFLRACSRVFHIREADSFDPNWLFQMSNFGSLIELLSKLSNTEDAVRTGAEPFGTIEEDIYGGLEDLADEHDLANEGDIYDTVEEDEGDKIYDDLVNIRREIQQSKKTDHKVDSKKDFCRQEIMETEKKYVEALQMLCDYFIKPLKQHLTRQDIDTIFLNIEELLRRHRGFLRDLDDTFRRSNPTLAQTFKKHKNNFLIYGFYCSNMLNAQNHIEKVMGNPSIRMKVEECQKRANENRFRLRDLLSVPMQRILKYHLLLKELVKNTDKADKERKELEEALDEMQDVSLYVNEVKRDFEMMATNEDIQASLVNYKGESLNEYGRNQKDGELKLKFTQPGTKKSNGQARYCFLFDKVMLVCRSGRLNVDWLWGNETHEYMKTIDLAQYKVEDNLPSGRSGRTKWNYCFHLTPKEPNNIRGSIEVYCKTEEMMFRWVEGIRLAQDNIAPRNTQGHKVEYVSFPEDYPTCDSCHKLLRGLFFQGYKCVTCGISVHKECLSSDHTAMCTASPTATARYPGLPGDRLKVTRGYSGVPVPPSGEQPLRVKVNDVVKVIENISNEWKRVQLVKAPKTIGVIPSWLLSEQYEEATVLFAKPSPKQAPTQSTSDIGDLFRHAWYAGEMDRHEANVKLQPKGGCFLVRKGQRGFAISLHHEDQIKHMRVIDEAGKLGLAEGTMFSSMEDLVEWYSRNSLVSVFRGLDAYLRKPFRDDNFSVTAVPTSEKRLSFPLPTIPDPAPRQNIQDTVKKRLPNILGYAKALYDFAARDTRELSLHENEQVCIISKAGGHRGWWKGCIGERIGYFPSTYVEEIENGIPS